MDIFAPKASVLRFTLDRRLTSLLLSKYPFANDPVCSELALDDVTQAGEVAVPALVVIAEGADLILALVQPFMGQL